MLIWRVPRAHADETTLVVPPDRGAVCGLRPAYCVHMTDRTDDGLTVVALRPDTWELFEGLAGRHNGVFGGCWCFYFHRDGPERGQGAEANRELKKRYVEQGKAHAALVVDGDEAIAWCA